MTAIGRVLAAFLAAAPMTQEAFQEQMSEAIRRHDGGDYAGAISIYRSVLKERPHDPNAVYELSLSMMMGKSPPEELIAFIEAELKSKEKHLSQLYATLASAYDARRDFARGEAVLRKGLKVDPKSADLQFNLGVNLMLQNKTDEAEEPLRRAVLLKPQWASAWRAVAVALEENHKVLDAFLAKSYFVAMEPDSERGKAAAQLLWPLLMQGIDKKDDRVTVTVGKNVDDMPIKLLAATRYAGYEKRSDGEFFVHAIEQAVAVAEEKKKPDELRTLTLQLFQAARKDGVLEALSWMLRRSAGDREAESWFSTHRKEEARLEAFFR